MTYKPDIFITTTEKDYNKLPYVLDSINRNIEYNKIIFCSPTEIPLDVEQFRDKEILDIDISRFKYRKFWVYQQFLKLFQDITSDFYITIDSDTIINKPLKFFQFVGLQGEIEAFKPIWYKGWNQNNAPYYEYNKAMFGFDRVVNHTFLADMNFFDRNTINGMLHDYNYTVDSFIEKSFDVINDHCYPSEADIYGNYYSKHISPDLYIIKDLKTECVGKNGLWTKEEIENRISSRINSDLDTFSLHSWT